ncbi:hypothetical protein [Thalassobacillus sp. C254]|uniref:hypothetical protein n=1 Tax=Thalassobacillus sp. C254 TaxID=1225341 RepID=UPI0006D0AA12|nr:hypothetical protein [Thalassobacillus sp. C254]
MNQFVNFLDQFNVFSPNHSKIYDEYTNENGNTTFNSNIDTLVETFLIKKFNEEPHSMILTGNAGDGKTKLCRNVYDYYNEEPLSSWPEDGIVNLTFLNGRITIVKDLSELREEVILKHLIKLQENIENNHRDNHYYLIAANEGKLTKFLTQKKS